MDKQEDISQKVLKLLYETRFSTGDAVALESMRKENKWEQAPFDRVVRDLEFDELIRVRTAGPTHAITTAGILHVEKHSLADQQIISKNGELRIELLRIFNHLHETDTSSFGLHFTEVQSKCDNEPWLLSTNLDWLVDVDLVEEDHGLYKITHSGIDGFKNWTKAESFETKFQELSKFTPQKRGLALQKLLGEILEFAGWEMDEGLRTEHEEIDVLVHKEREYYLAEAKWLNKKVGAEVIRELLGKLKNRIGVNGILFSMSGITAEAQKQITDFLNDRIILVFGKDDINKLIELEETFDDLLAAKYHAAVSKKQILYD